MKNIKTLAVLLGLTDQLREKYKAMVRDYKNFFVNSQGAFKGEKRTYTPREGTIDEPGKRSNQQVVTTVKEKLDWFIRESATFINAIFSQEKTNASGGATAELVVDGKSWGTFTSLELLRLKTLLEKSDLENMQEMINRIPVRSDSEVWAKSSDPEYDDREVFETKMIEGVNKTTEKEHYVLEDPNVKHLKDATGYQPVTGIKSRTVELGDYTFQKFSGEISHRERAEMLKRRSDLLAAVMVAIKEANETSVVASELTAERIFGYVFYGKNKAE